MASKGECRSPKGGVQVFFKLDVRVALAIYDIRDGLEAKERNV